MSLKYQKIKKASKRQSIVCVVFGKFCCAWAHWVLISFHFITTSEAVLIVNHKRGLIYKVGWLSSKVIPLSAYEKLWCCRRRCPFPGTLHTSWTDDFSQAHPAHHFVAWFKDGRIGYVHRKKASPSRCCCFDIIIVQNCSLFITVHSGIGYLLHPGWTFMLSPDLLLPQVRW